jgi:low affinity Fe/Cu permease
MAEAPPTVPPPRPGTLSGSLKRNIEALEERRRKEAAEATREERLAQAITSFTGSIRFVYLHLLVYAVWILANLGVVPGVPKFDPSFVVLAMEASVEAIFLSTFVLISQNRTAAAADKRADLDLHINLLAEHELTKLAVNGGPIPGQRGGVKAGQCRQDLLLCKGAPIGAPLHGAGLSRGTVAGSVGNG